MDADGLYAEHHAALEDFWGRRQHRPRFRREGSVFGRRVIYTSNHEGVLEAAGISESLYTQAPRDGDPPFQIQFVIRAEPQVAPPPDDDLMERIVYAGEAGWIGMQVGEWGHVNVDMGSRRAVLVLSVSLAARPDLVSRFVLNTVLNNLLTRAGYAMLHASCLVRNGHALLLMAPHGAGKSTTALQLAQSGFALMSDSQVYVSEGAGGLQLDGFPVGRIKLRQDVLARFPEIAGFGVPERVRGETKLSVDLRQMAPDSVWERRLAPEAVTLGLLEIVQAAETAVSPATRQAVEAAVMANSLHFDEKEVWRQNLARIDRLLRSARLRHLRVGSQVESLIESAEGLMLDA